MNLHERAHAEKIRVAQITDAMEKMNGDRYHYYATIVFDGLNAGEREVLNHLLHQGPVWDGNIISKSSRDNLLDYGLAVRCCYKGEDGYTACSYAGSMVFKAGKAVPFPIKEPAP